MCLEEQSSGDLKLCGQLFVTINHLFEIDFDLILLIIRNDVGNGNIFLEPDQISHVLPVSEVECHYHGLRVNDLHVC